MALLELSHGLSNEACVSFGEINWFVLRRCLLWRPLLICACPMEELKGLGGVAGMSKTKYTSQQWERSKKKKAGVGMR